MEQHDRPDLHQCLGCQPSAEPLEVQRLGAGAWAMRGSSEGALATTVLPAASAGMIFEAARNSG